MDITTEKMYKQNGHLKQGDDYEEARPAVSDSLRHHTVCRPPCICISLLCCLLACLTTYLFVQLSCLEAGQLRNVRSLLLLEERHLLCVPCSQVSLHPEDDPENLKRLHVTRSQNETQCCARDAQEMSTLLQLVAERKYRIAKARGTFDVQKIVYVNVANGSESLSRNRPSAHLLASIESDVKKRTAGPEFPQEIPKWDYQSDNAFVSGGLQYKNGRLVVLKAGNYYIYSNVAFMKYYTDKKERALSDHAIMHIVARYNTIYPNGGEERLFVASLSQCWAKEKKYGEYVSHLGGIMRLSKGDEVYVKVRDIMTLLQRPKATYFGIYML